MLVAIVVATEVGDVEATTVKVAVELVFVVSVIVSVQAVEPQVNTAVAVVLELTVGEPILSPVQVPLAVVTVNTGAAVDHIEFNPEKVIVPLPPGVPWV